MKLFPCYMIEKEALIDQGLSWQCCSIKEYLSNKLSGKYKVRIDWYKQPIPLRK